MIFYGDRSRTLEPRAVMAALAARHPDRDVQIEFGTLAQAVLDQRWRDRGNLDGWDDAEREFSSAAIALARGQKVGPGIERHLPLGPLPVKSPEGFAHYALYPEFYAELGRQWRAEHPDLNLCVIGLRSIGTTLAAAFAAAAGIESAVTLRPSGHVFAREPRVTPRLSAHILGHEAFALIDEGPGLSGSSLGGVADWLEDQGVARERIFVFPSHGGALGPYASARHRGRWAEIQRRSFDLDDALQRLPRRVRLEDLSAGAWRRHLFVAESDWPPAWRALEQRKFLFKGRVFAKFNGLVGEEANGKLARARALAEAGFSPAVLGRRHGFRFERWYAGARTLWGTIPKSRGRVLARLNEYLVFRARAFQAGDSDHDVDHLTAMIRQNFAEYFAPAELADLDHLARAARRAPFIVHVDNRLHPWEWINTGEDVWLKTDAVDHSVAHDCVGPQDIAWDVVGARYELNLTDDEFETLLWMLKAVTPSGTLTRDKLTFYSYAYLAFQLGAYVTAAEQSLNDAREWLRLKARALRYAAGLTELVTHGAGERLALKA